MKLGKQDLKVRSLIDSKALIAGGGGGANDGYDSHGLCSNKDDSDSNVAVYDPLHKYQVYISVDVEINVYITQLQLSFKLIFF